MEEFKKKIGKVGPRGAKEVALDNVQTLHFCRNMIIGANGIYFTGMTLQGAEYKMFDIVMFLVSAFICIASYQFMSRKGMPKLTDKGALIDPGEDLNKEKGIAGHVQDLIIITSGTLVFSLFSYYMWFFLILVPIRLFYGLIIHAGDSEKSQTQDELEQKIK